MSRSDQHEISALAFTRVGCRHLTGNILPAPGFPRWVLIALLALATAWAAPEQAANQASTTTAASKQKDPLNRDTPQGSVFSFLDACHARDYVRASKYLDLSKLPRNERSHDGAAVAQQLGQILNGDAQFDVANLSRDAEGNRADGQPPDRERVDRFNVDGRNLDLQLERVTLRTGLSIWLFSPNSVALVPQLVQTTSDSAVERHLPVPMVTWSFLDMSLWRWIALLLLAAVVFAFSRLLTPLALRLVEPLLKRIAPRTNWTLMEGLLGPLQLLLGAAAFRAGVEWIGPSLRIRPFLERTLALILFLGLAWLCLRIVDLIINHIAGVLQSKHRAFSHSVLPLASRVLKIVILLLIVAAVLSNWGYNTNTIIAGLGVGGIAVALAAQKTIENFFGGVAVVSDRPVAVGDFCKFGDRMGTVEDIGLRSTRIRTLDRTLVTVPNGQFSTMTLENFDRRDKMLFHFTLNLRRDTKPEQVRSLLAAITRTLTEHKTLESGPLPVRFVGVGTYSLDLEVFTYVLTKNGDEFNQIQQDLYLWILDAVEAAGTALALPTQASVTYSDESAPPPSANLQPREAMLARRR